MAEPDVIGALVAALADDAATTALVGDAIFGGELPEGVAAEMPKRAIVVAASGGPEFTGRGSAEVDAQRIDLFGYGATPEEANRVRSTAARRLWSIERETHAATLVHWVNRAGGFSQARDRDGQWPQSFQSFQVFYSLQEVQ